MLVSSFIYLFLRGIGSEFKFFYIFSVRLDPLFLVNFIHGRTFDWMFNGNFFFRSPLKRRIFYGINSILSRCFAKYVFKLRHFGGVNSIVYFSFIRWRSWFNSSLKKLPHIFNVSCLYFTHSRTQRFTVIPAQTIHYLLWIFL